MSLNEVNTVEAFVRDQLCGSVLHHTSPFMGNVDHA